jgi:Region found in RelA / SpoT proteins
MKLTQMQDIGGCRAVVTSVDALNDLVARYDQSRIKHKRATCDDYIAKPRRSGYRGVHLVYRYRSDNDSKMIYNDLKIELQLRSQFQHAWATAVETVGTFIGQALKSSIGQGQWLRFFQLMGTAIAIRERTPAVPETPGSAAPLIEELLYYVNLLNVGPTLSTFANALRTLTQPSAEQEKAYYYLLRLDANSSQLTVSGFRKNQSEEASEAYLNVEKSVKTTPGLDAVLVSVDSIAALERAYPNYFADTRIFAELMNQALSGQEREIELMSVITTSSSLSTEVTRG